MGSFDVFSKTTTFYLFVLNRRVFWTVKKNSFEFQCNESNSVHVGSLPKANMIVCSILLSSSIIYPDLYSAYVGMLCMSK